AYQKFLFDQLEEYKIKHIFIEGLNTDEAAPFQHQNFDQQIIKLLRDNGIEVGDIDTPEKKREYLPYLIVLAGAGAAYVWSHEEVWLHPIMTPDEEQAFDEFWNDEEIREEMLQEKLPANKIINRLRELWITRENKNLLLREPGAKIAVVLGG